MQRAHGAEAALLASRASYIAGLDATATVEVSYRYGIALAGTMAHSFVQAHELESQAFQNFARCHPQSVVLLIDTYDVLRGAQRAVELAHRLKAEGIRVQGVRIDAFCLGTRLVVSEDAPSLDCAYKLQQFAGRPVRKLSQWKETWPGPRQVYRQYDSSGYLGMAVLACENEVIDGQPLLHEVMTNGRRLCCAPPLSEVRVYCVEQLAKWPPTARWSTSRNLQ